MQLNELTKKLAIGTVQFGLDYGISNKIGKTSLQEAIKILEFASDNGIDTIDTAQDYGNSEEVLGKIHNSCFKIVSKIKVHSRNEKMMGLIEQSLQRLNTEQLYGILFHNESSALNNPWAIEELIKLKETGVISNIGYSAAEDPEKLESLIERFGVPDIVQIPYSHIDRRFQELAKTLHGLGVEVHTRSAFLQGLFFISPSVLPKHFDKIKVYLEQIDAQYNETSEKAAALLMYVLKQPYIDKVVIGVNSQSQLERNIHMLDNVKLISFAPPEDITSNILMPNLWPKK